MAANTNGAENPEQSPVVPAPQPAVTQDEAAPGAAPGAAATAAEPAAPTLPESRLPTRKDTSLREFLNNMDDYAPIVCPPPATFHLLDYWNAQPPRKPSCP